ncbi:MAG: hypothetical protein IJ848_00495 [Alphaproteobacteria bacterium]|nr:hypothetical protein [Alphaproteobacteria bacterium]
MTNIKKILSASIITSLIIMSSCPVMASTNCVKQVQFIGSLGIYGGKSKIKAKPSINDYIALLNNPNTTDPNAKAIRGELLKGFTPISSSAIQDLAKDSAELEVSTPEAQTVGLYGKSTLSNNNVLEWQDSNVSISLSSDSTKNTDGSYNIVTTLNMSNGSGTPDIMPHDNIRQEQFNDLDNNQPDLTGDNAINGAQETLFAEGKQPQLITPVKIKYKDITVPDNLYQFIPSTSNNSEIKISDYSTDGWQFSGFASVGALFNTPLGGSVYLLLSGEKPFSNSEQKIAKENDNSSKNSENNNESNYSIKSRGNIGIELGLRCNFTEKVWAGVGGGFQHEWYKLSYKTSSTNSSSSDSSSNDTSKDMVGNTPYLKVIVGVSFTDNIGAELFYKYTPQHDLKNKEQKSSNDNNSTNNNKTSVFGNSTFTKQGSSAIGFGINVRF